MSRQSRRRKPFTRRGAVSVEFAILAPVLLGLLMVTTAISDMYDAANTLQMAVRHGGRLGGLGSLNFTDTTPTNDRIADDIRAFLNSAGLQGEGAMIQITNPDTGEPIPNLDDAVDPVPYYQVDVTMPYDIFNIFTSSSTSEGGFATPTETGDTGSVTTTGATSFPLSYTMVFHNGQARPNR